MNPLELENGLLSRKHTGIDYRGARQTKHDLFAELNGRVLRWD